MLQWVIDNFGQYAPITDPVTGEALPDLASIDWSYIAAVLLFMILLIYALRIILAFFKGVSWK